VTTDAPTFETITVASRPPLSPADALAWAIEEAADRVERTGLARQQSSRHRSPLVRSSTVEAHEEALALLAGLRALSPGLDTDDVFLELADAGVRRLVVECWPSRSRSLYRAVWRQGGKRRVVEARSHAAVLRRVLRAARAVSGDVKA
jgi:hypothetical protein